eukprot:CAMPEP_0181324586 /NCGR_PEP_ID=MMETSP1101-20121128/20444_1 /TAXON_ID=46948 /ORGANISM="Rhodomonas abbreviata, Strain Caron Lab Isolate" /LENGTH=645 /DNA_ID=CAMNT_0023432783 /DNA_START=141 /DNA_END=2078 /DNA_ORIENTATION=+
MSQLPLNAPAPGRAVPFQPGMSYGNPTRRRFPKSHVFEFKVGVGRDLSAMPTQVDPLERVVTTSPNKYKMGATLEGDGFLETDFGKQAKFVPSFVGLDGKVLRFFAQMTDNVPEARSDSFRDRQFTILYFLVDDSIQVIEQRKHNSGYMQGVFMKRHKVPRAGGASQYEEKDFVSLHDFVDTPSIMLYGRVFKLTGCNNFTAQFYDANGLPLAVQAVQVAGETSQDSEDRGGFKGKGGGAKGTGGRMNEDFDTAKLRPNQRAGYRREKFLKFNNKVLRFYGLWDDRKSMFGDKRHYVVNFYLADDALEVLERYGINEGRDPYPKLIRKSRVPKRFHGLNGIGVSQDDVSDKVYIRDMDLQVGETIEVYGRKIMLYGCDEFTRHFFRSAYGVEQPEDCPPPEELMEFPLQTEPPYTGFGTEEDSIASFYRLLPRPRAFDALKQEELDKIIFRWKAKFDLDLMEHAGPDDSKRRFVVSFYMSDSTVAIYEPPVSNSGFLGGKFLQRQRVRKHGTSKTESSYLAHQDLLFDLPGSIWINNYPFVLLESDRFTLRYKNKGNIASLLSIDSIHWKIRSGLSDLEGMQYAFEEMDPQKSGSIWLDGFVRVMQDFDLQLDEDEMLALVQHWDKRQDGTVQYQEFVEAIGALH